MSDLSKKTENEIIENKKQDELEHIQDMKKLLVKMVRALDVKNDDFENTKGNARYMYIELCEKEWDLVL